MSAGQLVGKVALISGAGRNNGRAIATRFAQEGADLVLVARSREAELHEVADECEAYGAKVLTTLADVTSPASVERVAASAIERFSQVDVLVNVVGVRPHKLLVDTSYEDWKHVFETNCDSLFLLAKAVLPGMVERGRGSIIALGGMAAVRAQTLCGSVVASKHALYGLVKSLAIECGPAGVRVNLVNPGHITNFRLNPEWYASEGGAPNTETTITPLRRVGGNDEVANAVLFLASDQSSYITGDRMMVVGGRFM